MKKSLLLTTAALFAALTAGPAFAQPAGSGADTSSAPATATIPSTGAADSGSTAAIRLQSMPEDRARGFFMDDTMAELQGETENRTYFGTLTAEEQTALRAECDEMKATATGWMADLCTRVETF